MQRLSLANTPTKISKLERLSSELGKNIWIKRDDQTGTEISGNKIRKLEYSLKQAIDQGYDTVITCGGLQSNHCRATAAAAAQIGMKSILLLRVTDGTKIEGNYFLDKILGAEVIFCTPEEYRFSRNDIMNSIASKRAESGQKVYVIPEGASNGIGCMGYYSCYEEILEQERAMGVVFDDIVVATGSGGTYTGLVLANKILKGGKRITGFTVCDDAEYFTNVSLTIGKEALEYIGVNCELEQSDIHYNDKYSGIGYALSTPEELNFIAKIASLEGLILDPVYTGKAMKGLYSEIKLGTFGDSKNILFIHTGGLFGLFPKQNDFIF